MTKHQSVSWVVVCLMTGCELIPTEPAESGDTGVGATSSEGQGEGEGKGEGEGEVTPQGGWTFSGHPCVGYRTDTLWVDEDEAFWVGCGSTTNGYGLYRSVDGGLTWQAPETNPPAYVDGMRVSSISRSSDGLLYLGGIHGAEQVVSLDTSSEPMLVSEVFTSTSQVWNSFQVGTFRRNSAGQAVAESLNGTGLAFRPSEAARRVRSTSSFVSSSSNRRQFDCGSKPSTWRA